MKQEKQETITIGEKTFTILFPDLVRQLSAQERQDMRESIEKFGIKQEVVIDTDNGVIDGGNRLRIAAELGLPVVPTRIVECANEEEKRQLALSLNIDRRHLTPKEREQMTEARRQRVRKKRMAGKSLRTIAEEEGVSHEQIRKDLASDAGVNGLTPEKANEIHNDAEAPSAEQPAPETPEQSSPTNEPEPTAVGESTADGPAQQAPAPATIKGRDGKRHPSKKGKKASRNDPPKCNIKGLVKEVKQLVKEKKLSEYVAKQFAENFDRDKQQAFIGGKNASEIQATILSWDEEQKLSREANWMLNRAISNFQEWDVAKASPEGRQRVFAALTKVRDFLHTIMARIDDAGLQHVPASEEMVTNE